MIAIIRLGNQQFKVKAGDFVRSAFLKDSKETIQIPVLALEDKSGFLLDPAKLKTAKVTAKILREGLAKKVLVFKKKRRKGYRRTRGHRQKFTELQILEIALGSSKSSIDPARIVSTKKRDVSPTKKLANKKQDLKPVKKVAKTTKDKTAPKKVTAKVAKKTTDQPVVKKVTAKVAKKTSKTQTKK